MITHTTRRVFWSLLFWQYVIGLAGLFVLAYLHLVSVNRLGIPNHDLYLHFFLIGGLALLSHRAFGRRYLRLRGSQWPLAILLVSLFSIAEECMQLLSATREFEFSDMAANLAGIWLFYLLDSKWVSFRRRLLSSHSR